MTGITRFGFDTYLLEAPFHEIKKEMHLPIHADVNYKELMLFNWLIFAICPDTDYKVKTSDELKHCGKKLNSGRFRFPVDKRNESLPTRVQWDLLSQNGKESGAKEILNSEKFSFRQIFTVAPKCLRT
jgi:hypothetical protein